MLSHRARSLALAAAFLLPTVVAGLAVPDSAVAAEKERKWFIDLGWGKYRDNSDIDYQASNDNHAFHISGGYQFFDYLAVEAGYVEFGDIDYDLAPGTTSTLQTYGPQVKVVAQFPMFRDNNGYIAPFISAGGWRWDVRETVDNGVTRVERSDHDFDAMYGAGITFRGRTSALRIAYERYQLGQDPELNFDWFYMGLLFFP